MNFRALGSSFMKSFAEGPVGRTAMPGPLSLFQAEQRGKLRRFMSETPMLSNGESRGMLNAYFAGANMRATDNGISFGADNARRGKIRRIGAGVGGGILAANALGINPFGVRDAAENLGWLGAHATVGHAMYGMGGGARLAGMAYMGAGAINTFRGGDNLGPM